MKQRILLLSFSLLLVAGVSISREPMKVKFGGTEVSMSTNGGWQISTTVKDILAAPELIISPSLKVVSYKVTIMPHQYDLIGPYSIKGAKLPPQIASKIKGTGTLILDEIRVLEPDGLTRVFARIQVNYSE